MIDGEASRTAVLVCQARAAADRRLATEHFGDPIAIRLLRDDERAVVERVRAEQHPRTPRARLGYDIIRATMPISVSRTVVIDDALREANNPQVVILGAGLDARAWRMSELAGTHVFEVDHPATQQDKRDRVKDLTAYPESLHFVPVDFARDTLRDALAEANHDYRRPTTWIWEGVLSYLREREVDATLADIARRSAAGSRLVTTYTAPSLLRLGRWGVRLFMVVAGAHNPLRNEPPLSTWKPEHMRTLLSGHGFGVTADRNQRSIADELSIAGRRSRHLALSRVAVSDRTP